MQDTLVGDIYILSDDIWTLECLSLYKDKNIPTLVQYFSKENKNIKKLIVLDTWSIKKEDRLKILNDIQIYPFSIIRPKQKILIGFTTRKERTVWKNYLYSTKHFKFPLDINILAEPCIICDTSWEIVSINTSMSDFLSGKCKIGDNVSIIMQDYFPEFCKYCKSILEEQCVLYCNYTFLLPIYGPENTKYTLNCRISSLKHKEKTYFLCQLFSIHDNDNDNISSLEKNCQESLRILIKHMAELSQNYQNLKNEKSKSTDSLNIKISLNSMESTPRDANSSPILTPIKKTKFSVPMIKTRGNSLSMLRFEQSEIRNGSLSTRRNLNKENKKQAIVLNRTDGFTARVEVRGMITNRKLQSSLVFKEYSREWTNIHPRVAVIGGGNALFFGWQLACAGSEVTIIEHQEERALLMNEYEWHMLDEVKSSSYAIAFASLMLDLKNSGLCGRIYATTWSKPVIRFADILILEIPPLPFDDLLYLQIKEIESSFQSGQILLLECDTTIPLSELDIILLEINKLLPNISFTCITSCSNIFELENQFKLQVGLQIDNINKCIKNFIMNCNSSRMKNLIVLDNGNYDILHSIIEWIINDYGTRNLFFQ